MSATMTASLSLDNVRRDAIRRLQDAGIEEAEADARVLLGAVLGISPTALIVSPERTLAKDELAVIEGVLLRRLSGEPVARILGRKEFWSLTFALNGTTLVPRPETETIVEAALAEFPDRDAKLRVLDLGTGTGALLAAILSERPFATGVGLDKSEYALRVARNNLEALRLDDRASFVCGDWAAAIGERFDLIVANPPYIAAGEVALLSPEVRDHDPRLALDGGADGLDAYRGIVNQLYGLLTANGVAVLELGQGQEPSVADIVRNTSGLQLCVPARSDLSGIPRALVIHAKR